MLVEAEMEWRSRIRLVDEVVQVLRERIYVGAYAAGEALRQEVLAADLQVSRTPLREALRVLENDGLVENQPGRGYRVVSADVDRMLRAYAMREMVDGLAARLAAERVDERGIERLHGCMSHQAATLKPWNAGAYTLANVDFHTAIIGIADNEYVSAQLPLVRMTSQVFTPVRLLPGERVRLSEHEAIVDAIARHDPEAAERAARLHIRETIARLEAKRGA